MRKGSLSHWETASDMSSLRKAATEEEARAEEPERNSLPDNFLAMAMGTPGPMDEDEGVESPPVSPAPHALTREEGAGTFSPPTRSKFFQLVKDVKTPKSRVKQLASESASRRSPKNSPKGTLPVDPDAVLMSPDLAFKTALSSKKKKKKKFDQFKQSISTSTVAPDVGIMSPSDEMATSPVENRKTKSKGGFSKKKGGDTRKQAGNSKRSRGCHPVRDTYAFLATIHLYCSKAISAFAFKQCSTALPYVYPGR